MLFHLSEDEWEAEFEGEGVSIESLDFNLSKTSLDMTITLDCDSVEGFNGLDFFSGNRLTYNKVAGEGEFGMELRIMDIPTKDHPEIREMLIEEMGEEMADILFNIADNYYVRVIVNTPGEILSAEGIDVAEDGESASLFDKVENLARNQGINFTIVYEE